MTEKLEHYRAKYDTCLSIACEDRDLALSMTFLLIDRFEDMSRFKNELKSKLAIYSINDSAILDSLMTSSSVNDQWEENYSVHESAIMTLSRESKINIEKLDFIRNNLKNYIDRFSGSPMQEDVYHISDYRDNYFAISRIINSYNKLI